tara:strand:+ start:1460 stop:1579 length:120 start_codon:yes stop_codon:yes gene_type:complete
MIDKTIRIDLTLTPREKCLTGSSNSNTQQEVLGAASYKI